MPLHIAAPTTGWRAAKIGNGGIIPHLDTHSDGTWVCTTDSFGGYIWDPVANQWQQLLTATRMPGTVTNQIGSGFDTIAIDPSNSNNIFFSWWGNIYKSPNRGRTFAYAGNWPDQSLWQSQNTVPSKQWNPTLAIDPNNSNIIYVNTPNRGAYVSTDGGATWSVIGPLAAGLPINTGQAPNTYAKIGTDATNRDPSASAPGTVVSFVSNSINFNFTINGTSNLVQVWSASDPTKQYIGYVSTASVGTTFSLTVVATFGSGFKTDWNVSYINNNAPGGQVISGGHRFCFDTSGGTVGGKTKNIYVHTYGVGTWQSTDGGATWTLTAATSRPATIRSMACDPFGVLWVVTDEYPGATQNTMKYDTGVWSNINPGTGGVIWLDSVAVDAANSAAKATTHICFGEGGHGIAAFSIDGGSTWTQNSSPKSVTSSSANGDVAWIDSYFSNPSNINMGSCAFTFSKDGSGRLWMCGEGVFYVVSLSSAGGAQPLVLTQMTRGIEEFIAVRCIAPNPDSFIATTWDFPGFYTNNFNAYPAGNLLPPGTGITGLEVGLDVDWLWSNPNRVVCVVGSVVNNISTYTFDSVSSDGGKTWTPFPTQQTFGNPGGMIAIADTNVWVKVFSSSSQPPKETTDGGTTWNNVAIPGLSPSAAFGSIQASATTNRYIDSDKANGNIYLYSVNDGSTGQDRMYKRTRVGGAWSLQMSLGIGTISRFNGILKSSGVADCLFFTPGLQAPPHPGSVSWYFTTDGWASVMRTVTGFQEVQAYGFGAKFGGSTFPTVFAVGWYTGTALIGGASTPVTNAYGIWMCKNFDTSTGNGTWSLLKDFASNSPYPLGILSNVTDINGDPATAGKVYCFTNGGAFWGLFQ